MRGEYQSVKGEDVGVIDPLFTPPVYRGYRGYRRRIDRKGRNRETSIISPNGELPLARCLPCSLTDKAAVVKFGHLGSNPSKATAGEKCHPQVRVPIHNNLAEARGGYLGVIGEWDWSKSECRLGEALGWGR